jgi:hypothetical protein
MCRNCTKRRNPSGTKQGGRRLAARVPGELVKLRYLGDSDELLIYEGAATRTEYTVGGKINLVEAYQADLATGISWAPGLLEITGEGGKKLFEIHVPLKEEMEAEARAKARAQEAWENAEALALPPEEPEAEPKRKKKEPDGESPVSGD